MAFPNSTPEQMKLVWEADVLRKKWGIRVESAGLSIYPPALAAQLDSLDKQLAPQFRDGMLGLAAEGWWRYYRLLAAVLEQVEREVINKTLWLEQMGFDPPSVAELQDIVNHLENLVEHIPSYRKAMEDAADAMQAIANELHDERLRALLAL